VQPEAKTVGLDQKYSFSRNQSSDMLSAMAVIPTINSIEDQLRRDEGQRFVAYQDSLGYWTIGVGRCIDARKGGVSQAEVDFLLVNDINSINANLKVLLPWSSGLDPVRFGVLQNLAFNMGIGGLLSFRNFLADMEAGNWDAAASELQNSEWATQVGDRAQRLMLQVTSGEWQ
jgi:lysozyme